MFIEQLFKETEQKDRNLLDDCDHRKIKKYNMGGKKIKVYCIACNTLVSEKLIWSNFIFLFDQLPIFFWKSLPKFFSKVTSKIFFKSHSQNFFWKSLPKFFLEVKMPFKLFFSDPPLNCKFQPTIPFKPPNLPKLPHNFPMCFYPFFTFNPYPNNPKNTLKHIGTFSRHFPFKPQN